MDETALDPARFQAIIDGPNAIRVSVVDIEADKLAGLLAGENGNGVFASHVVVQKPVVQFAWSSLILWHEHRPI